MISLPQLSQCQSSWKSCSSTELSICKHGLTSSPAPVPLFTSPANGCCRPCDVLREAPTLKSKVLVSSGLLWFKPWCDIKKGESLALTDTSEGPDASWNEGSQLLHASSFPSTDLHLDEKAALAYDWGQNKRFCQQGSWDILASVCVWREHCPHSSNAQPLIYLLSIKEQALFWEVTGTVAGTALT